MGWPKNVDNSSWQVIACTSLSAEAQTHCHGLCITTAPFSAKRYCGRVRWDHLFDDLEGQLARERSLEENDLAAEDERLRLGRLELRERLRGLHEASAGTDYRLVVTLREGTRVAIHPVSMGRDWMLVRLVDGPAPATGILALGAIDSVALTPGQARNSLGSALQSDAPRVADRLGLGFVLRDLCRRRRYVEVLSQSGVVRGTFDRVGRDHADLAVHEPPRRAAAVAEIRMIAFDGIQLVTLL